MVRFIRLFTLLFLLFFTHNVFSQDSSAIQFSYNTQRLNDSEVVVFIKGNIKRGIKLFALHQYPADVLYSTIQFDSAVQKLLIDSAVQKGAEQKATDPTLKAEVHFFTDSVSWQQKLSASLTDSFLVKGEIS